MPKSDWTNLASDLALAEAKIERLRAVLVKVAQRLLEIEQASHQQYEQAYAARLEAQDALEAGEQGKGDAA